MKEDIFRSLSPKRAEQTLMSVIQEAYINGISAQRIGIVAKEIGIERNFCISSIPDK